jgi:hypothetical protein
METRISISNACNLAVNGTGRKDTQAKNPLEEDVKEDEPNKTLPKLRVVFNRCRLSSSSVIVNLLPAEKKLASSAQQCGEQTRN